MNFIVYDLEATCWKYKPPSFTQEIIEIGAVKVNPYGETVDTFNHFVKPVVHPNLSAFCTELTSITQEDVDKSKGFEEVLEQFQEFIGIYDNEDYLLCSWGFFDRRALQNDCTLHKLEKEWAEKHISLKHQYKELKRLYYPPGLKKTLDKEGFEFSGTHHRGIDDAINLTKIFSKYIDAWQY